MVDEPEQYSPKPATDDELDEVPAAPATKDDARPGDVLPRAVKQRLEALIPDLVKKTFAAGMGAVFTTEEGVRRIAKELSLPKDVASYLANTAGNTKDELVRIVAREVREFLQTVNLADELAKILTTLSFEVKTEIRFIPNDEQYQSGVTPDVRASVKLKKNEDRARRPRRRRRRRRFLGGDNHSEDNHESSDSE
jgi:hypothetical protein